MFAYPFPTLKKLLHKLSVSTRSKFGSQSALFYTAKAFR